MAIIQSFNLNMIPNGAPQVIHINQNDTGTGRLQIYLFYDGEPYIWNNSASFKIRGTKADMQTFEASCVKSGTDYIYCDLTDDMDDVAGDVYCNIEMIDGSERVGTQAFILRVQKEAR